MELHPLVFALLAYGIAAVIAVVVAFIVKVISFSVQRRKADGAGPPEAEDKGGDAA
jgi:hypothetical protein